MNMIDHDTIVMTVILVFVILGVLWLAARFLPHQKPTMLPAMFDFRSCDICDRTLECDGSSEGWEKIKDGKLVICPQCVENEFR